ncbi:hypothetical protein [Nocardioides sp.]|uniref:hypothetical protein n=1 Tax=Nocardioides sp. TaxID=35761 RepID=UPI00271AAB37|nr:hypothetical protein [Nocardioides sp.]MDO9458029.1 hypothetical protein [Nocardioides sp.]
MTEKKQPRPPQATLLGGAILIGSVFVVMLAFDRMASLGSIEAQEQADVFVKNGFGQGIGITADQWQSVLRVLCVVAGGVGVVTAFLGFEVLQRKRRARLALSLLAPVLLVAGTATSDFVATIVVVAIALLWRQPVRDWLNGVAVARHPALTAPVGATGAVDPAAKTVAETAPAPVAPAAPVAPTEPAVPTYPAPTTWAGAQAPYGQQPVVPAERPSTVLAAVLTTIVASAVSIAGLVALILVIKGDSASLESEFADMIADNPALEGYSPAVLVDVVAGILIAFIVWAFVAIVLAVLTARGIGAARIALVVSSIMAALASLVAILTVVALLVTAACVAVAVLLLRQDAAAWFARKPHQRS